MYGLRGKQRSVHNNYFTLPVLFIMISNHYPMTFGITHAWLVLVAILLLAAYVRHFFNLRHRDARCGRFRSPRRSATLVLAVADRAAQSREPAPRAVVRRRRARSSPSAARACHAEKPTQPGFASRAEGRACSTRRSASSPMRRRSTSRRCVTHAMPIGNLTGMTDAERATLGAWIAAGAP